MKYILIILFAVAAFIKTDAQELQARVTINHNQIQGTDASVFDNLQQTLEQFINDNWPLVASASVLAGVLSLLTSVAGLPEVDG